nr:toxin C-terminal domain-containing protein [Cedecea davisae]
MPNIPPIYVYLSTSLKGKNAEKAAKILGYNQRLGPNKAPFNSHGQPAFFNGKDYITPDVDGHNVSDGWKKFSKKGVRLGTYDKDLNRIKG